MALFKKTAPAKPSAGQSGAMPPASAAQSKPAKSEKNPAKKRGVKRTVVPRTFFVLTLGDDGAILTHIVKGKVEGRWFAPDAGDDHKEVFARAFKDIVTPLLVLLDSSDQSYIIQNLPPVNKMALGSITKRRLAREFPNSEIRTWRLLGKEAKKEWRCQFIAAEKTEKITAWFDWILSISNPLKQVLLVPVEMELVTKTLYGLSPKSTEAHSWLYLFSHHKVSGFRQVILRDGKMVFTRIGQPLQGPSEVMAGLIEQEINTTVEYLKRLGLKDLSHLHMELIASQDIIQLIDTQRAQIRSCTLHTPHQAAELLGIQGATQANDRFGDTVISTIIACQSKWLLPITLPIFASISKLQHTRMGLLAFCALALLASLGMSGLHLFGAYQAYTAMPEKEAQRAKLEEESNKFKQLAEGFTTEEVEVVKDVAGVYKTLQGRVYNPVPMLYALSAAQTQFIGRSTPSNLEWKAATLSQEAGKIGTASDAFSQTAIMAMVYTSNPQASDEERQQHFNVLQAEYTAAFEDYTVTFSDLKGLRTSQDKVNLDFSATKKEEKEPAASQIEFKLTVSSPKTKTPAAAMPSNPPPIPGRPTP